MRRLLGLLVLSASGYAQPWTAGRMLHELLGPLLPQQLVIERHRILSVVTGFARVGSAANCSGGTDGGTTSAVDTTGANSYYISASWYTDVPTPTVQDSKSLTWLPATSRLTSSYHYSQIFYAVGTGGGGHTFTVSGTGVQAGFCVLAFSGAALSPLDQSNGHSTWPPLQPGSVTPTQANELMISSLGQIQGDEATIDSNFVITGYVAFNTMGTNIGHTQAYWIDTGTTTTNPTWTHNSTGNYESALIATFKHQ